MATCAACMRSITPRDQFVLAGTEVFHRACAHSISSSVGTRQKLELVRLRQELDAEQRESARLRTDLVETKRHVESRLDEQAKRLNAKNRELRQERDEARRDAAAVEVVRREMSRLERLRDAADQDARSARAELELHQALAGTRNASSGGQEKQTEAAPPGDLRDDSEQRFSLLELDPLE